MAKLALADLESDKIDFAARTLAEFLFMCSFRRLGLVAAMLAKLASGKHKPKTIWACDRLETGLAKLANGAVARDTATAIWAI